jgi:hypothetical protein
VLVTVLLVLLGGRVLLAQPSVGPSGEPGTADAFAGQPALETDRGTSAPGDGFTIGDLTFKIGGRIKVDVIRDFKPIGSTDTFDPRTIPVDGSRETNSRIHARESRLFVDVRGDVDDHELQMYVEGDFYGTSNAFRMRHAYARYGGLLIGQTWSTFMDADNIPNTIDFETPVAAAVIRQAMVRWTARPTKTVSWSVAVEDNASDIVPPQNVPGHAEYPMPDLIGNVRYVRPSAHVQISSFLGLARFRPNAGPVDNETLWGVLVSGRARAIGHDAAYSQLTVGDGIGRYRGAVTAVPDASGQLRALHAIALTIGYEHLWSDRLSSNAVYSRAWGTNDFAGPDANRQLDYGAVNLRYWFLPHRAWAGVEYLFGRRQLNSGADGAAHRLQFGVRFDLPQ